MMKNYSDLTKEEKALYNKIVSLFVSHPIGLKSFIKVLAILINNYKLKRRKKEKL